ncbi:hypothetical protein SAMN04487980_101336 [Streptomyces sp. cf124]|uniref:hypothetical protein n=1 Tax=Streptomyces TaxID=1883 RepID=UPI0008E712D7|nr:hypothetical protein [Streptomyces sp. cf124]SFN19008.1 hypothetical protein SAMN04487980_101336 [Streptomyces sp. cf124]
MTPGNQNNQNNQNNQGIQAFDVSVHGVGVNHGQVNQYVVREGASPEERLQQGIRTLRAGMRDRAEQMIGDVVGLSDTPTPQALYYLALSIVSRRSPENLTDEDWHKLRHTLDRLAALPGESAAEYGTAGRVLRDLMSASLSPSARSGARVGGADAPPDAPESAPGGTVDAALLLDGLLDDEVRIELMDHLRYVLRGIEQDALDAEEEGELGERLAKKRAERAPLFFTPDPELHLPRPPKEPTLDPTVRVIVVVCLAVLGVTLLLDQIPDDLPDSDRNNAWTLLVVACVALAFGMPGRVRSAARYRLHGEWREDPDGKGLTDQERNPFHRSRSRLAVLLTSPKQWREDRERRAKEQQKTKKAAFRRTIEALVQDRFLDYEPKGSDAAKVWRRYTERRRTELIDDLTHRHWRTVAPGALDWLIQLRAKEIGGQHVDPPQMRLERALGRLGLLSTLLGVVLLAAAVLQVIPADEDAGQGMSACASLIFAGAFMWLAAVDFAKRTAHQRARKQYENDMRARRQWLDDLGGSRPDDDQMARWYDLDQRYLRREVLAEHRMEHRDILFSFSLVEGVPGCVRAKVKNGPPRYSEYRQTLYVLTSSGVWVSSWNVDFATGEHGGRQDTVFRYDAISSVTVESVGVRFGDSLREIVSGSEDGSLRDVADEDDLVMHEAMRLVLHNGQRLTALLENYEHLYDSDHEDRAQLRRLALESSGISVGFRILTAMATEGRRWFEQRRRRSYQAFTADQPARPSRPDDPDQPDCAVPGGDGRPPSTPSLPPALVLSE